MRPSKQLLDEFRERRKNSMTHNMYAYTMGRIEGILGSTILTPKKKIALCIEAIAALDIVMGETYAPVDGDLPEAL